uniref:Uncharacterized protein n=1 Tax=Rousettus aegyptiacus TaxID=9407 RepID=A0A7J8DI64_ROUAE|nr:hypothetical protein HJG63_008666 [Rousettus aegyptiacus]
MVLAGSRSVWNHSDRSVMFIRETNEQNFAKSLPAPSGKHQQVQPLVSRTLPRLRGHETSPPQEKEVHSCLSASPSASPFFPPDIIRWQVENHEMIDALTLLRVAPSCLTGEGARERAWAGALRWSRPLLLVHTNLTRSTQHRPKMTGVGLLPRRSAETGRAPGIVRHATAAGPGPPGSEVPLYGSPPSAWSFHKPSCSTAEAMQKLR